MKKKKIIIIIVILVLVLITLLIKLILPNDFYILYNYHILIPNSNEVKTVYESIGRDHISFEIYSYNEKKINNIIKSKKFKEINSESDINQAKQIFNKVVSSFYKFKELSEQNFDKNNLISSGNYYYFKEINKQDCIFILLDKTDYKVYVFILN